MGDEKVCIEFCNTGELIRHLLVEIEEVTVENHLHTMHPLDQAMPQLGGNPPEIMDINILSGEGHLVQKGKGQFI
jgi:hypothetical protein